MHTEIIPANDFKAIQKAIEIVRSGNPVAFPTDTVYGVGVDAFNSAAIQKLFVVKERDRSRAIPILLGDINHLPKVIGEVGFKALRAAEAFWPGPLTLVVPRHPSLPETIAPGETVGVRMPDHAIALRLLRKTGPLAATSANISGAPNPRTAQDVASQLGGRIPLILDGGQSPGGIPSTVLDCTGDEMIILRHGPVSIAEIERVFD